MLHIEHGNRYDWSVNFHIFYRRTILYNVASVFLGFLLFKSTLKTITDILGSHALSYPQNKTFLSATYI